MRTFGVVLSVTLLAFVCFQRISALPFMTVRDPPFANTWTHLPRLFTQMPYDMRENNYPGPVRCRFCCGCCLADVCGLCCD
uniref:Hepcidin n=1 Tax=Poecilia mexicana TaxID=48701 RepID=A0A3B3WMT4_9TELE